MSDHTALSEPIEMYTILDVIAAGGEVQILINDHRFALVQDGQHVVVSVEGEQHRFAGCTEIEIREAMAEWAPGAWG